MAEDGGAMTPQPTANPDAHTTVNDFLDYTEYFPSDLVRSLRLIADLDSNYVDATQKVHELTVKYGKLPTVPANERPDPTTLRSDIAAALEKAIYCRESTFAEASRLYEVAERHFHRINIINTKLKALPEPPERDPTPVPVPVPSPQLTRPANPSFRLKLAAQRGRRDKRPRPSLSGRPRSPSTSDSESDVDVQNSRKLKLPKDRTPKPPKSSRVRVPGSGTNVHSQIAGISTSNALAQLSPPPPDAKPGSKWAPWFQLTEYEMAVLRKKMKKNAVWTPSEGMIKKQLNDRNRGQSFYDKEKARCEAMGEDFLNEEPAPPSLRRSLVAQPAVGEETPFGINAAMPAAGNADASPTPVDHSQDPPQEDVAMAEPGTNMNPKRESQRRQAKRDALALEEATKKLQEAADTIQELEFATPDARNRASTRTSNKRKRDASPPPSATTPAVATREPSQGSQDGGAKQPDPKRIRILPPLAPAPAPASASTPKTTTPVVPSPVSNTPVPLPDNIKTTTVQVPLAPAGPSTPKSAKLPSKAPSRHATPGPSPTTAAAPPELPALASPGQPPAANITAASTRPKRESMAPRAGTSPPLGPEQPVELQNGNPSALELAVRPMRPRSSRGHVPTPKAQSEEPKPLDAEQSTRELRRHSIFSPAALPAPTRASARRKPPPKGEITAGEAGQKTVTTVKRAQGNKNNKKKKTDDETVEEAIDAEETRYCICDDVSYGQMISCDNNCDKEWFHLECVNMTEQDIPGRRAKWFCPDCREQLQVNSHGNPLVPPTLPGRNRGNRGWSA